MTISFYSFSEPLKSGLDFFNADEAKEAQIEISISSSAIATLTFNPGLIYSNISVESNLIVSATKVKLAQSIIIIDGATLTLGTKIKLASAVLSVESSATVTAKEILFASASISASITSTIAIAQEILKAQILINIESNMVTVIKKDSFAASVITPSSEVFAAALGIKLASSALSGSVNLTIVGKIILATIRIIINNIGNVTTKAIKFIVGNVISASDLSDIRTVLLIDDKPITNHNRKLGISVDPIFVENINWNNRKSRYYKSSARPARRTFNLSWSYVPNSHSHTVDGKRGRDYLKEIAGKPQHHVLKIVNMDENSNVPYTETSYNVLVKDYSETLIRRDLVDDIYFFDCSMSLEEV